MPGTEAGGVKPVNVSSGLVKFPHVVLVKRGASLVVKSLAKLSVLRICITPKCQSPRGRVKSVLVLMAGRHVFQASRQQTTAKIRPRSASATGCYHTLWNPNIVVHSKTQCVCVHHTQPTIRDSLKHGFKWTDGEPNQSRSRISNPMQSVVWRSRSLTEPAFKLTPRVELNMTTRLITV